MLGLNTSLKGSESPPLEQRGGVMNWWHDFVSLFVPTADDGYAMRVPCGREARRAFPPGGVHGRARLHGLSSKVHQPLGGNILDAFQSDATDCSTVFLCRDHDEGLLLARAAPLALFRSTNVGVIDVNLAVSRSRPGRTKALRSLCSHVQAGSSRPKPSPRCSPMALMPFFWLMMNHIARNYVHNGVRVSGNTVPAVRDVLLSQALHRNTPRAITQDSPATPQRSQTNLFGQHKPGCSYGTGPRSETSHPWHRTGGGNRRPGFGWTFPWYEKIRIAHVRQRNTPFQTKLGCRRRPTYEDTRIRLLSNHALRNTAGI